MKFFTLGTHGFAPNAIAQMLGLPHLNRQAQVLVSAPSRAEAYRMLAARGMQPDSPRNPEFQPADGEDVQLLAVLGFFAAPAVLVTEEIIHQASNVVRVEADGHGTLLGRLERHGDHKEYLRFVPTPAGVDGPAFTEPMNLDAVTTVAAELFRIDRQLAGELVGMALLARPEHLTEQERDGTQPIPAYAIKPLLDAVADELEQLDLQTGDLVAAAKMNVTLVARLNQQLTEARLARARIADRAIRADQHAEVAKALGVSVPRLYHLRDAGRVEEARRTATARSTISGKDCAAHA